ncbi:Phosphoenolpyruvate-protein phosphotransferase / Phosphocarrier protein HPr / PTS system fructose-specific EIIA component [Pseudomonas sp. IT-347P]|uniref:phosphoenolpyruvate--protein phosphotransferase n=1 Tax=Pseudomonas sp. IT-347P TaxID=3026458 RepID=UPI0039E166B8
MATPQPLQLLAPLSGVLMALEQVPDPVFSGRVIGDGLCIDPTSSILCAPIAGVISNVQASGHAVSITDNQGVQVLMHIGLDTVNLGGQGFTRLVEEGQRVAAGEALIEFDADYIARQARSLMTLMLVVSGEPFTWLVASSGRVETGEPLLELVSAQAISEEPVAVESPSVFSQPLKLANPNGLHARPAAVFAQAAKGFAAKIYLHKQQAQANAKSLVAIMALQTAFGDSVQVSAMGEDADEAIDVLTRLLAEGCGETVTALAPVEAVETEVLTLLRGVCASPGSALGQVVQISEPVFDVSEFGGGSELERAALANALIEADLALQHLRDTAAGEAEAEIFKAHQELLEDPGLLDQAQALIDAGKSAAFAWRAATDETAAMFRQLGSALLAERAADLTDVGRRVLKCLLGIGEQALELPQDSILIADQLTPSQTASIDTSKVLGFATVGGGATSHVAILARACGLPSICGVPVQMLALSNGTPVLLDADNGELHVHPDPAAVNRWQAQHAQQRQRHEQELANATLAARTRDGHLVEVSANVASLSETEQGMAMGGAGVGLLRSEFLYLGRNHAPGHDEQVATYSAIARCVGPAHNLVVRTLDVGGDKPLAYMPMESESNPFLGMRGIRLCLERPQLLREQFRAMLGCCELTRLHIMLPMVTQLSELRLARQMLDEEILALGLTQRPKLGIMIEVPAAALMADLFAPLVDFFSIGTNDLTQYTLAMDRDHPRLAGQADSFHPSVLRLIAMTVKAAHAHGKWVGVCGAMASERLAVPLLLGLCVDELSVSVPMIAPVKATVRELALADCQIIARQVLGLESAGQVREALQLFHEATVDALRVLEN